jgi:hypothetical protein
MTLVRGSTPATLTSAVSAGVNVHEYLIELQRNKSDVKKNPDAYLPWVYQARLTEEKSRTGAEVG